MSKVYLIVEMRKNSDRGHGGGPEEVTITLGGINALVGSEYQCPVKGKEYPAFTSRTAAEAYLANLDDEEDYLFKFKKAKLRIYELPLR